MSLKNEMPNLFRKGHSIHRRSLFAHRTVSERAYSIRYGEKNFTPELIEEMRVALINAVEALRATEVFMCGQGLETDDLIKIVRTVDELLDRVDEAREI